MQGYAYMGNTALNLQSDLDCLAFRVVKSKIKYHVHGRPPHCDERRFARKEGFSFFGIKEYAGRKGFGKIKSFDVLV